MSERRPDLIMIVPEAHKAFGMAACVSGLRVLTCSVGETVHPLEALGAEVVSVESKEKHTTQALLESSMGQAALRRWAPAPVLVFRPEHKVVQALNALGLTPLCAEPAVARRLENKRAFRALCRQHRLPAVRSVDMVWPPGYYFGDAIPWPRIVQTARGHAGKRTWFWESEKRRPAIPERLHGRKVLVTPVVEGPTWTINGVVAAGEIGLGDVMRQINGDPRLAVEPFSSAGVAFNPPGVEAVEDEVRTLARQVGELAHGEGFRGFFGIDAVGEPGRLRLIEMNARLTATLTAATLAELAADRSPLLQRHVDACQTQAPRERDSVSRQGRQPSMAGKPTQGGHLVLRRTGEGRVAPLSLGTYVVAGSDLEKVSDEGGWPSSDQVAIWPAGPAHGGPTDECLRLLFSTDIVDRQGRFTTIVEEVLSRSLR